MLTTSIGLAISIKDNLHDRRAAKYPHISHIFFPSLKVYSKGLLSLKKQWLIQQKRSGCRNWCNKCKQLLIGFEVTSYCEGETSNGHWYGEQELWIQRIQRRLHVVLCTCKAHDWELCWDVLDTDVKAVYVWQLWLYWIKDNNSSPCDHLQWPHIRVFWAWYKAVVAEVVIANCPTPRHESISFVEGG